MISVVKLIVPALIVPTDDKLAKVVNVLLLVAVIFPAVVAVAALPVTLPTIGFVTVKLAKVPTLVKLELVIVEFNVVPVKVPASAVAEIVISVLPSKGTPLIFFVAANFVAVAAFPFTLPTIGLVTVKLAKVPTLVKLELVTVEFKVVPVKVPASTVAEMVISVLPSKGTPLIFFVAANFVAVAALPFTLPTIGLVTVKLAKVPTLVKLELVTVDFNVVPVKVPASAVAEIVISALPSKGTPLIFFGAANFVAVAAFPFTLPTIGLVTVKLFKVPTLVKLEPVMFEFNVVPANELASAVAEIVMSAVPSKGTPLIFLVAANLFAVAALPVVF